MKASQVKKTGKKPRVGDGTAGPGRPKGVGNKSTANAREAIGRFVDGNAERLQEWLDKIAQIEGPKAAFMCFKDLIEYHVPKLGRSEHSGPDGKPLPGGTTIINISKYPD